MNIVPIINLVLIVIYGVISGSDIYESRRFLRNFMKDLNVKKIYLVYTFFLLVSLGVLLGINSNLIENPEDTEDNEEKYKIINITFMSFMFLCTIIYTIKVKLRSKTFAKHHNTKPDLDYLRIGMSLLLTLITIGFILVNVLL
jgi:magnesium-transporting ATPase (P-type)